MVSNESFSASYELLNPAEDSFAGLLVFKADLMPTERLEVGFSRNLIVQRWTLFYDGCNGGKNGFG